MKIAIIVFSALAFVVQIVFIVLTIIHGRSINKTLDKMLNDLGGKR